ncbi:hypothetical protein LOAG_08212 [Loa loa]|uniref:Uncharacterized protein n=1 Tax=Loa loa TaxID=7209 RepID=A0A1S0TU64_LOALO|nr:hypothetical protein LOAG_08212 [Loa loa]EFO20280.1 hypothetical protein LOAG_08212 [Loa loa]
MGKWEENTHSKKEKNDSSIHLPAQTPSHIYTYTHAYTYTHTYIHTYTYTYTTHTHILNFLSGFIHQPFTYA